MLADSSGFWSSWAVIIAAAIAGVVALLGYIYNGMENRKAVARRSYADAVSAVMNYKGLPFRIRRRQANDAETRSQLLMLASDLQERLDFFQALLYLDSQAVGAAYSALVDIVRNEAGTYCDEAWRARVISDDSEVELHLGDIFRFPLTARAADECLSVMNQYLRKRFLVKYIGGFFRREPVDIKLSVFRQNALGEQSQDY
jgi:hypothetical protein